MQSPLLEAIFNAVSVDDAFEAAVECICTIYHDTKEVEEYIEVIHILYPHIMSLRPKIQAAADADDKDTLKGLTRLFSEAAEAWVLLIVRLPLEFRGLVEAVLECCARDQDRECISLSFIFWFEFKQLLTISKYTQARNSFTDVWSKLVDIMIRHLEFPQPESGNEADLFEGDREQEEKFREFRHQMGDVLKDCCEVITVTECLSKVHELIKSWISMYASRATATKVPHWQSLEAPLFAMRAMGRVVPADESQILHQVIPLIVHIPDHEKLRFQAIMALGRYTEWTAQHPEYLQPQLNFILSGFNHSAKEVVQGAALAFRYFGTDCRKLLRDELVNLHGFYDSVLDRLPPSSQEEVTEGVSAVVGAQPPNNIYAALKLYCDPIIERLKVRADTARAHPDNKAAQLIAAGTFWPDKLSVKKKNKK